MPSAAERIGCQLNALINKEEPRDTAIVAEDTDHLRVCVPTTRNFARNVFLGATYEAQDVLTKCADADLLYLEPQRRFQFRKQLLWKLLKVDVSRRLAYVNPGIQSVQLEKDYDLFVFNCPIGTDPLYFNAIRGWKDRCKTSVCWINELWAADLPRFKNWLFRFREFDHVIVGLKGSVEAVSNAIGRSCHYVPGGVDAIRFSPCLEPPSRVINVYSVGRRLEGIHQALLKLAALGKIFYVHDTMENSGNALTSDYQAHRNAYANMAKRSHLFMVAQGFVDTADRTRGQIEVGFRYYEGSAAGAILVGQTPDCDTFRQTFDWPDAVVDIKPDGSDTVQVITDLLADPDRLQRISRRNAVEALLRHDWVYRWKEIFAIAGIKPTRRMKTREKRLKQLADGETIEEIR